MSNRREIIKLTEERSYVTKFVDWFNRENGTDYSVTDYPNPPDAIIVSSKKTTWVEVSDAFWTDSYARDAFSYATPEEKHKPMEKGPYAAPDLTFATQFMNVVKKKIEKDNYIEFKEKHGPGYLVIPIRYPLFNETTLAMINEDWPDFANSVVQDKGCFKSIYIAFPSRNEIVFLELSQ